MNSRLIIVLCASLVLQGCISYKLVESGETQLGDLALSVSSQWNEVPSTMILNERKGTKVWTQHGPLLDRFILIPGTPAGESIFVSNRNLQMPVYEAGMLPNDIEELVESSILKFLGESETIIETANLKPYTYGGVHQGFVFDLTAEFSEGPKYMGKVGGFVFEDELYVMIYIAATPHYYETYLPDAVAIIESARVIKTES